MLEIIKKIGANVLTSLYQSFNFSVIMTVLIMFVYLFAREYGCKTLVKKWVQSFKEEEHFRRLFLFVFYTIMILFKTLLNRNMWANPVSNVIGIWGLYNNKGELTTEVVENLALFIPFAILLLCCFRRKLLGKSVTLGRTLWQASKSVFLFSLTIEFLQLFLRLGTFQLSDLFYNTLGGILGSLLYWCGYKIKNRK